MEAPDVDGELTMLDEPHQPAEDADESLPGLSSSSTDGVSDDMVGELQPGYMC